MDAKMLTYWISGTMSYFTTLKNTSPLPQNQNFFASLLMINYGYNTFSSELIEKHILIKSILPEKATQTR